MVLAVAISAILGAFLGQVTLNEHARNLSLAINDASRVIEQIRQQNSPCNPGPNPSLAAPGGGTNWDAWLTGAGGGKSLRPDPANNELVVVTCQDAAGGAPPLACDGTGATNPVRVTVAVCWRHRGRTLGECTSVGALAPNDGGNGPNNLPGVVESPAMLTTLVTCR